MRHVTSAHVTMSCPHPRIVNPLLAYSSISAQNSFISESGIPSFVAWLVSTSLRTYVMIYILSILFYVYAIFELVGLFHPRAPSRHRKSLPPARLRRPSSMIATDACPPPCQPEAGMHLHGSTHSGMDARYHNEHFVCVRANEL